jgi:hypothetical protein
MKLLAFSEFIEKNPFNALDKREAQKFVDARNDQFNNWREFVYKELKGTYGEDMIETDAQDKPHDTIEGDEKKKEEKDVDRFDIKGKKISDSKEKSKSKKESK